MVKNRCIFGNGKAQITVFIILGIILLFVSSLVFYFTGSFVKTGIDSDSVLSDLGAKTSVEEFVESCLDQAVLDSIYITLANGGYYDLLEVENIELYSDDLEFLITPIYFNKGNLLTPSTETISKEVSGGTTILFKECLNDFDPFLKVGYTIEAGEPIVVVNFEDGWTTVNMDFPFVLTIEKSSQEFDSFVLTYPFSLPDKFFQINEYLMMQEDNIVFFQVGSLSKLAYFGNYDFNFGHIENEDNIILISYLFEEELWDKPLLINFGLLFDEIEVENNDLDFLYDNDLDILDLWDPDIFEWNVVNSGVSFFKIPVDGINYSVEPISSMLEIDSSSGIISLFGDELINDNYLFYIDVEDEFGVIQVYVLVINVNIDHDGDFPKFIQLEKQEVIVGEEFRQYIELDNPTEETVFFVQSSFISINSSTGQMSFLASEDLVGEYTIRIDAVNQLGSNWMSFELEVSE